MSEPEQEKRSSKFYTGTSEHDGKEIITNKDAAPSRRMTMYDIMNMNRHQRRAFGKQHNIKIPGIQLKLKDVVKESSKFFMKPDAKVQSVLDIESGKV